MYDFLTEEKEDLRDYAPKGLYVMQGPRNDILRGGLTGGDSMTPLKKLNSIFLRRS